LWVGSMNEQAFVPEGTLFRIDADLSVHAVLDQIVVANSIAFSPDDRTLYFADTRACTIWCFDFDCQKGAFPTDASSPRPRRRRDPTARASTPTVFSGIPISPERAWSIMRHLRQQSPTAAFQRVIERAVIHVQSSSREEMTGANVLVAIFAERESHAAYFLQEQGMTRYDAINYLSYGAAKGGGDIAV
jgi:SMP-30/Gluconolactonase/LRE-like region